MGRLLVQILVTWMVFKRSHLVTDFNHRFSLATFRCDQYFCTGILINPDEKTNCSHLFMGNSNECRCGHGKLWWEPHSGTFCDDIFVDMLPVIVDPDRKIDETRPKLRVKTTSLRRGTFYLYKNTFLRYLSLTKITDFEFTVRYNYLHVYVKNGRSYDATCDDDVSLTTPILNLSENYSENRVRKFTMTESCIYGITGMFSLVFPHLRELKLSDNVLRVFNSSTLVGLTKIEKLDLSNNFLTRFENDSVFHGLSSVSDIDLSRNNFTSLNVGLLDPLVNLQVLNLSRNRDLTLHPDIFWNNKEIRVLDLSWCNMNNTILESGTLKGLHKLEFISLISNRLSVFPSGVFPVSLKHLKLGRNGLTDFSSVAKMFSNLVTLEMSYNCLDNSSLSLPANKNIQNLECKRCCLDNWGAVQLAQLVTSTIDFRGSEVNTLDMNMLNKFAHLKKVYLGSKKYTHLQTSINLSYPLYIDSRLQQPNTQFYLSNYNIKVCEYVTLMLVNWNKTKHPDIRMVRSDVSFVITDFGLAFLHQFFNNTQEVFNNANVPNQICSFTFYCPDKCECTTKGLSEIITVNCSGKELTAFPNTDAFHIPIILDLSNNNIHRVENPLSNTWTVVSELYLNNNGLEFFNDSGNSPYLRTLDLRNNRLRQFPSFNQLLLRNGNKVRLLLSHNPWQCDCEIHEKEKNLVRAGHVFADLKEIMCLYPGRIFYLFNSTSADVCPIEEPPLLLLMILLPILLSLMVVIVAAVIVYYRHKEFIKFWLFTHGFCLRFVTEEDIDEDKIYDAFVSYSSLDEDWVSNKLVPGLENEPPSYKLCLHDRDWSAGEWIIEQIFASVKQSRRTIIVLTDNFVESSWSLMEFMAAYKQSVSDQVNRVLVVVPGEIPDDAKLGPELKSFVTLNTYIQYDNPYFWRKLRSAMPRVKQPCAKTSSQEEIVTASSIV